MPLDRLIPTADGEAFVYMSIKDVKASATAKARPIARVYRRSIKAKQQPRHICKLDHGHALTMTPNVRAR